MGIGLAVRDDYEAVARKIFFGKFAQAFLIPYTLYHSQQDFGISVLLRQITVKSAVNYVMIVNYL